MRTLSAIAFILLCQLAFSQLAVKPIKQKTTLESKSVNFNKVAPATLPFWDDFSITKNSADSIRIWGNDTTSQWDYHRSKDVFINSSLAINPPTYNVATFDGLDANGAFHADNELSLADQLQSDTIDLSSYDKGDSIFFSFYWQAGGNVEKPDEGDSLRLQFYNPNDSDPWTTKWMKEGDELLQDSLFTHKVVLVDSVFLTDKFVFRFQSFGDLDGPFDAWHVDWIYLNAGRSLEEEANGYGDGALSGQLSSPITPFTSIPAHQFSPDNKYVKNQEIGFSFLNRVTDSFYQVDVTYNVKAVNNNLALLNDTERASNPLIPSFNYDNKILGQTDQSSGADSVFLAEQDFSSLLDFDSAIIEAEAFLKNNNESFRFLDDSQIDLTINDTVRQQYLLHDYYAYDDGSAEYAAGTNILNGQVAVKFWLEEEDTLTHVAFHFPNIVPSAEGKSLTLNVFKTLNEDSPALRSQQINVETDSIINGFTYYELTRPLVLSDTFFISYQQNTNDYIGVGFDRSNMEASEFIFENKGDGWEKNISIDGALMIRPIFKEVKDFTLGNGIQPKKFIIYPNPTEGTFIIDGDYLSIELMTISGKVLFSEKVQPSHSISNLKAGLYLLRVHQLDGVKTYKIIKK